MSTHHTEAQAASKSSNSQVRLNVNMNAQTADALRELAAKHGISFTEAIRRAISIYKFFDEEAEAGRKIQTMKRNGEEKRDVVLM